MILIEISTKVFLRLWASLPQAGTGQECLERIGKDSPEEVQILRDLWEDDTQREVVMESLKADCKIRSASAFPRGIFWLP